MSKPVKKTQENTETEPEEEQYLVYNFNVSGDAHFEFHNCHDIKIMSGQPTQPAPPPPK